MGFSIDLYKNESPVEKIGKTLNSQSTINNVALKRDTSILRPVLLLNTNLSIFQYNYMYISEFGRYYFIDDIRSINDNLWEISAHVDVLETYKTQILANNAVIRRQEKLYNLYLDDPEFHVLNYERIQTLKFPANAFSKNLKYVLVVNNDRYW